MVIFKDVRKKNTKLPIIALTATSDPDTVAILKRDTHTTFLAKWSMPSMSEEIHKHADGTDSESAHEPMLPGLKAESRIRHNLSSSKLN